MATPDNKTLTQLLQRASSGEQVAKDELFAIIYPNLRRMASKQMKSERAEHTLQPTALVNEMYLRLFGPKPIDWQNRAQFFAIAATTMRRILVDHARNRRGMAFTISLDENEDGVAFPLPIQPEQNLLELDEMLQQFEAIDPRGAQAFVLQLSCTEHMVIKRKP